MKSTVLAAARKMSNRRIEEADLSNAGWGVAITAPLAVILSFPVWLAPAHIEFKDFETADIVRLLTTLFVVALLAERALEVFVGTWRSAGANQHELNVTMAQEKVTRLQAGSRPDARGLREARTALEDAKRAERQYRCATRKRALWIGLTLGLLVAGVGLRALQTLIDPALNAWSTTQSAAFHLVDVALTGGVIAGGSEGIHRIVTVFDNFMNATAKRAKDTA
jgi:hypothetical protein